MSFLDDSFQFIPKLIDAVRRRPALYAKNLQEYSDLNLKKRLWEEVCETVIADWDQQSEASQIQIGRELQRKWGNLRTCFRREVRIQKGAKPGRERRHRYVYYKKLLFLLPYLENSKTVSKMEIDNTERDDDDEECEPVPSTSTSTYISRKRERSVELIRQSDARQRERSVELMRQSDARQRERSVEFIRQSDADESLLKQLRDVNHFDEDIHFALSIVPSLKKLDADEKLDAKIGILNVIKQIKQAKNADPITTYTTEYKIDFQEE